MTDTVVVTGATGGVGSAVARAFAEDGAHVVAGARDGDAADALADMLDGVVGVRADARDEYDVERLMETAARVGGGVDVVVPCDVVYHGDPGETPLDDEAYSAFDDAMRSNARGAFAALAEALPHATVDARAVVPTGAARESPAGYGAYAVSTAAVDAVARGFAADTDLAVGRVAVDAADVDDGLDPAEAAELIQWAASLDADALDGARFSRADWRDAVAD